MTAQHIVHYVENVSFPSYIGSHPIGGRRGGIRTSIPISESQRSLQWLSSEVSLRVPILRSEFFEGGLKVLPKLSLIL